MLGTFVLSAGYYDAYYSKAQKARRLIQDKTNEILNEYDFILLPTTPHTAFKIGEQNDDPVKMYLEDIFTAHANLSGSPAISLLCPLTFWLSFEMAAATSISRSGGADGRVSFRARSRSFSRSDS